MWNEDNQSFMIYFIILFILPPLHNVVVSKWNQNRCNLFYYPFFYYYQTKNLNSFSIISFSLVLIVFWNTFCFCFYFAVWTEFLKNYFLKISTGFVPNITTPTSRSNGYFSLILPIFALIYLQKKDLGD